jgi:hypothetical protein
MVLTPRERECGDGGDEAWPAACPERTNRAFHADRLILIAR